MLSAAHFWSLSAIAVVSGFAMLWAFERFSDQAAVTLAGRQLRARLYAFRLFADEPALIFRAQKQLLIWNSRYLALMLRPTAVILIPALLLMSALDALYGHRSLAPGESAIVTAQFARSNDVLELAPALDGRRVVVETPPLRIPAEHQVCWRIRAMGGAPSAVILGVSGASMRKAVECGRRLDFISERRVAGLLAWVRYPGEALLPAGPLRWIGVSYPAVRVSVLGYRMHWLVWFVALSLLTMLVAGKLLGIHF